jgi:hypothetical protein
MNLSISIKGDKIMIDLNEKDKHGQYVWKKEDLEILQQLVSMRLQDIYYEELEEAITMGLCPSDVTDECQKADYLEYLRMHSSPGAKIILQKYEEYISQEEVKHSMRSTK